MVNRIEADVRAILNQGGDPAVYRTGLASRHGVSVEAIDAAIAAIGSTPRVVDAETVAQERLSADRQMARRHPAEWAAHNHEEE